MVAGLDQDFLHDAAFVVIHDLPARLDGHAALCDSPRRERRNSRPGPETPEGDGDQKGTRHDRSA
jgi:hypothetical protein